MGIEQGSLKSGNIQMKVTDTLGNPVNPATEETLQDIKTAVETPVLPTGGATSDKQDSLLSELQLKADLTEEQPVYDLGNNKALI